MADAGAGSLVVHRMIRRPSHGTVVAYLALFVALGGSAYAVNQLPKKSVGTKQLKGGAVTKQKVRKNAINGSKVKNNSLTGADIKLSKLGTVPSAQNATTAQNAAHATSADRAASSGQRIDFAGPAIDPAPANTVSPGAHQLLSLDELTVSASCVNAGGGEARVYVAFTLLGEGHFTWSATQFNNPGFESYVNGTGFGPEGGSYGVIDLKGGNKFLNGQWIYRSAQRTIIVSMHAGAGDFVPGCEVEGAALRPES